MSATQTQFTTHENVLYVALELGQNSWKLAASVSCSQKTRFQDMPAGDTLTLVLRIQAAKARFGLPADAKVKCCYEAGRDGFWLHRMLLNEGIDNVVVDSSSIEVQRRRRRAKSDRLDAGKLLTMLMRYSGGETRVWSVVNVPSIEDEDQRQLHRELKTLSEERTRQINRIKGLLVGQGVRFPEIKPTFCEELERVRLWDGSPLPSHLHRRLQHEFERLQLIDKQMRVLEEKRVQELKTSTSKGVEQARRLMELHGVGINTSWIYAMELFSWRNIQNRRELGSLTGLTPTPYASGDSAREQGISKAGNHWIRSVAIELAWCWLQFQPQSALSVWYQQRFGDGARSRKIGIVALARKLVIALWRYLETGEIPEGAVLSDWKKKVQCRRGSLSKAVTAG